MLKQSEPTSSTLQLVASDMSGIMERLDTHELDLDDGEYDTADVAAPGVASPPGLVSHAALSCPLPVTPVPVYRRAFALQGHLSHRGLQGARGQGLPVVCDQRQDPGGGALHLSSGPLLRHHAEEHQQGADAQQLPPLGGPEQLPGGVTSSPRCHECAALCHLPGGEGDARRGSRGSAGTAHEGIPKHQEVDCVLFVCSVDAGRLQDRDETRGVHLVGEEEGETLHRSAQGAEDLQDLHEAAAAHAQVGERTSGQAAPESQLDPAVVIEATRGREGRGTRRDRCPSCPEEARTS